MFEDDTFGPSVLANPSILQQKILTIQNDRLNGAYTISDPNNGFVFLLDAAVSAVAQHVKYCDNEFDSLYAKRATTSLDLYKHMSDFDYLHITSKPATTEIQLLFDRDYLIAHAAKYSDAYNKVIIPGTTSFTIGPRTYGIYYPIEIRINSKTNNIITTYDTTEQNPLFSLTSNVVDAVNYTMNGLNMLVLRIPVYQFNRTIYEETLVSNTGFSKTYSYTDKFYAARVFTYISGKYVALDHTLSEDVYDREAATAQLKVQSDVSKISVTIPYIYFTKGLIGSRIKIELYTTQGAIDVSVTELEAQAANFNPDLTNASIYSQILSSIPTVQLIPAETRILGGSDGLTFSELRNRVITNSLYERLPVSPLELKNYVSDKGFALTQILDNVTNRIHIANKKLTGGSNANIPVTTANIELSPTTIANTDTILTYSDNMLTILPTTVYKYNATARICVPVSDDEIHRLEALSKEDLVDELNTYTYTRTPFHIVTYTDGKYPLSKTFNLNPSIKMIQFVRENAASSYQMTAFSATVTHEVNGTGGFKIRIGVQKSESMNDIPESALSVYLSIKDKSDRRVYVKATKLGVSGVLHVYEAEIVTNYHLSADRYFRTTLSVSPTKTTQCDIPLDAEFDLCMLMDPTYSPETPLDYDITSYLPTDFNASLGLVRQKLGVTFGGDMSDAIYNVTDAIWSAQTYVTYPENIYHTYTSDVYLTNPDGSLVTEIVDGKLVTTKLKNAGDLVLDESGNPVIKYQAGDYKRDYNGLPLIASDRSLVYYVDSIQFDARLYASESAADVEYVSSIINEVSSYTDIVSSIDESLIEQTKLYFKPIRTMGTATFGIGNGATLRMDLGISFYIRYYISKAVMKDPTRKQLIEELTQTIIESHVVKSVISLTDIGKDLRERLGDQITSIDTLGMNNDPTLQTIFVQDEDVTPMVGLILKVNTDGTLALKKNITVEYLTDS